MPRREHVEMPLRTVPEGLKEKVGRDALLREWIIAGEAVRDASFVLVSLGTHEGVG